MTPTVAIITPRSPHRETATAVAKAAAAVLTKLLPRRMVDSSFSGCLSIRATRFAPATSVLTMCSRRNLCKEIKAVSELEKKADKSKQIRSSPKYSVISILDI